MKNAHAALLAILNLVTCGIAAAAALQMTWDDWWHPLLAIGCAASIASSIYLMILERKYTEGSPERSKIAWSGNILFLVGIGLALGVLSAMGKLNL